MDLVTGGAGFIGSHLVTELVRRGRRVRVLDDFSTGNGDFLSDVATQIDVVEGSVLDPASVRSAMTGVERVFHLAAVRSVPRSIDDPQASNRVNVEGTLNVLVGARDAGVRIVVYASCSSVYGNDASLPLREDQAPAPLSPYAVAKLAGEHYGRVFSSVYDVPTVSLRYFNVFGPRQDPHSAYAAVIPRFLAAALAEQSLEIHGDGLQSRDFTYVDNVVLATCLAAESPLASGEVFNVGSGYRYSLMDIVQTLRRILGDEQQTIRWEHVEARRGDVRHTLADIARAREVLDYRVAVDLEEGLRRTLAWMKAAQLVPSVGWRR
jgi:UDP-N-acetylglucosamine/UDP-N-acetyl-alpha-D-glucosaminouronate 4-epimerase